MLPLSLTFIMRASWHHFLYSSDGETAAQSLENSNEFKITQLRCGGVGSSAWTQRQCFPQGKSTLWFYPRFSHFVTIDWIFRIPVYHNLLGFFKTHFILLFFPARTVTGIDIWLLWSHPPWAESQVHSNSHSKWKTWECLYNWIGEIKLLK